MTAVRICDQCGGQRLGSGLRFCSWECYNVSRRVALLPPIPPAEVAAECRAAWEKLRAADDGQALTASARQPSRIQTLSVTSQQVDKPVRVIPPKPSQIRHLSVTSRQPYDRPEAGTHDAPGGGPGATSITTHQPEHDHRKAGPA